MLCNLTLNDIGRKVIYKNYTNFKEGTIISFNKIEKG